MFLRGVLEVGHGGPEERANKQVAEGGRGETLIPCCARQATHNSNENPCSSFAEERFKYSHTGRATRRIKKHLPKIERVQAILLSNQLFFDVAFFTERRKIPLIALSVVGVESMAAHFPHTI